MDYVDTSVSPLFNVTKQDYDYKVEIKQIIIAKNQIKVSDENKYLSWVQI